MRGPRWRAPPSQPVVARDRARIPVSRAVSGSARPARELRVRPSPYRPDKTSLARRSGRSRQRPQVEESPTVSRGWLTENALSGYVGGLARTGEEPAQTRPSRLPGSQAHFWGNQQVGARPITVQPIYRPSGDLKGGEADPTCSPEAAKRGG